MLANLAPETERTARLAELLEQELGLSIDSFPRSLTRMLLERLPAEISTADPAVLRRVIAACSIGETMFMRHPEQFGVLRDLATTLPAAREGRALRAWSAGCATGEEAYSLAATLRGVLASAVEVYGSDVNPASIARAEGGVYGLWSLRGVDMAATSSWLRADGVRVEVVPRVRAGVHFGVLNLAADPYPGDLDVVFCRNVLLYFRPEAARRVLARIADALRPGGVLFLGYTDEAPGPATGLAARVHQGVRYFVKPTPGPAAESASPPPASITAAPSSPLAASDGVPQISVAVEPPADDFSSRVSFARGLAGQALFAEAMQAVHDLCARYPLEVEPNVLGCMIAQEAGDADRAVDFARRASFLDPHNPLPHYLLGACLDAAGESRLATHRYTVALMSMSKYRDLSQPVACGGGMTGYQLRRMIEAGLAKRYERTHP